MIELVNLSKKFDNLIIFNNVNIKFPERGMVFLSGKSGIGKTTLLNIISKIDDYDGDVIYSSIESNDDIGYMLQGDYLLENYSIKDNILIYCKIRHKDCSNSINKVLKCLNLYNIRDKKVKGLSKGQKSRLNFARVILSDPKIILADEITKNLDNKNAIVELNILKKLSSEKLIICVSHDKRLINYFADYIVTFEENRIKINENIKKVEFQKKEIFNLSNDIIELDIKKNENIVKPKLDLEIVDNDIYIRSSNYNLITYDEYLSEENVDFNPKLDGIKEIEMIDKIFNQIKRIPKVIINKYNIKSFILNFIVSFILLGICSYLFGLITYTGEIKLDEDVIYISVKDEDVYKNVKELSNNKYVEDMYFSSSVVDNQEVSFEYGTLGDNFITSHNAKYNPMYEGLNIILGEAPTSMDEIVISSALADEIIRELNINGINYDNIIGVFTEKDITIGSRINKMKVVGIAKEDSICFYTCDELYREYIYSCSTQSSNNDYISNVLTSSFFGELNKGEIFINKDVFKDEAESINIYGNKYEIKGRYSINDEDTFKIWLLNKYALENNSELYDKYKLEFENDFNSLFKDNHFIVSEYDYNYLIDNYFYGKFSSSKIDYNNLSNNIRSYLAIKSNNVNKVTKLLSKIVDKDYFISNNSYLNYYEKESLSQNMNSIIVISFIIAGLILINLLIVSVNLYKIKNQRRSFILMGLKKRFIIIDMLIRIIFTYFLAIFLALILYYCIISIVLKNFVQLIKELFVFDSRIVIIVMIISFVIILFELVKTSLYNGKKKVNQIKRSDY